MTTAFDPELAAMQSVLKTLDELQNRDIQQRVLDWVALRLGLTVRPAEAHSGPPIPLPAEHEPTPRRETEAVVREGTVNTVVSKLGASSCRTLLIASAAYLCLYRGKDKFTRDELVTCAKDARLWKNDYGVQLSLNIARMCDAGELIEKAKDVYDIPAKKLAELEQRLDL